MRGEPILIVDDTPVNLKLTRILLANEGYQVLTAAIAEAALELLLDLDRAFDAAAAERAVHQWIGTGGLLGCTAISRFASEAELLLKQKPIDTAQLRESMTSLVQAFSTPRPAQEMPATENILQA